MWLVVAQIQILIMAGYKMKIDVQASSTTELKYNDVSYPIDIELSKVLFENNIQKDLGCHISCFSNNDNSILRVKQGKTETYFMCENVKRVIGSQIELILLGFNNNQGIVAKVDTGATFCSLHATNIKTTSSQLSEKDEFVTFEYYNQQYRMPLVNKQSVQNSDGGITYRPVVKFNISMVNKTYEDVLFNLNDRTDMTHEILLGQNLLTQSRVLVDPTLYMEGFSLDELESSPALVEQSLDQPKSDFDLFKNLTLQEIVNSLKTFNS